jgi:Ankyrin repeats (3 copies)
MPLWETCGAPKECSGGIPRSPALVCSPRSCSTAYAMAVQSGQTETAKLLESRGANTDLSALDRFLGACTAADPSDLSGIVADSPEIPLAPEYHRLLPEFAASHRTQAVRALLAAGVPVNTAGDYGGTALHWACWKGYADLVKILIDRGASLTVEDDVFHGTPTGWFSHGLRGTVNLAGLAALARTDRGE